MCRTDIDIAICFKTNEYIDPVGERSRTNAPTDYYSSNSEASSSNQSLEEDNASGDGSNDGSSSEDEETIPNL